MVALFGSFPQIPPRDSHSILGFQIHRAPRAAHPDSTCPDSIGIGIAHVNRATFSLGSGEPIPQPGETTSSCEHGESTPGDAHGDSPEIESVNPRLARLMDAWPTLPDALKTGIMAMVTAASGDRQET